MTKSSHMTGIIESNIESSLFTSKLPKENESELKRTCMYSIHIVNDCIRMQLKIIINKSAKLRFLVLSVKNDSIKNY